MQPRSPLFLVLLRGRLLAGLLRRLRLGLVFRFFGLFRLVRFRGGSVAIAARRGRRPLTGVVGHIPPGSLELNTRRRKLPRRVGAALGTLLHFRSRNFFDFLETVPALLTLVLV